MIRFVKAIGFVILPLAWAAPALAAPTISPASPELDAGATQRFTANTPVDWRLAPGSVGTLSADGTYVAPATVVAKRQISGCQALPNDHVYNTRVDALPVHPNNAAWIAALPAGVAPNYLPTVPINVEDGTPPTKAQTLLYTPNLNGELFWRYPEQRVQSGRFNRREDVDNHILSMHRDSCRAEELYGTMDYRTPSCPGCTAASGTKFSLGSFALPNSPENPGAVDAAGLMFMPTVITIDELQRAAHFNEPISHVARFTLKNTRITRDFIWPGRANAYAGSGPIPYGAVLRLKSSYVYRGSNPMAAALVRQMKEYGLILGDGGGDLDIGVAQDDRDSAEMDAVFRELRASDITRDQLEFVDMSPLMVSPISGAIKPPAEQQAQYGKVYAADPDYAEVIAKDRATGLESRVRIALRGAAVGFDAMRYVAQAGTPAFALPYWVNGTSNKSLTWTMTPSIAGASLLNGVLTPPATLSEPVATRVTARSQADPSAYATAIVIFLPDAKPIRIAAGYEAASANTYMDAAGHPWYSRVDFEGRKEWIWPTYCGWPYSGGWGETWPDNALYGDALYCYTDLEADLRIPNGNYKVTLKLAETHNNPVPDTTYMGTQNKVYFDNFALQDAAGGYHKPLDLAMPAPVTDGRLRVTLGPIVVAAMPKMGAVLIEPDAGVPELKIDPSAPKPLTMTQTLRLRAVGWFMDSAATWQLVSGPGTLSANGLYTAPSTPQDGAVTVRAVSQIDPSKVAQVTFNVQFGTMTLAIPKPVLNRSTSQQLSVTIGGVPYTNIDWRVAAGPGSISPTGLYSAPRELSATTPVTIRATSKDNPAHYVEGTFSLDARPRPYRINTGGICYPAEVTDADGNPWESDASYIGGNYGSGSRTDGIAIEGALNGETPVYRCDRAGTGTNTFWYSFPLPPGKYNVRLMWAEHRATPSNTKFDVFIQGTKVLEDFGVMDAAGGIRRAVDRRFKADVGETSLLEVKFTGKVPRGDWFSDISGVEVLPAGAAGQAPRLNLPAYLPLDATISAQLDDTSDLQRMEWSFYRLEAEGSKAIARSTFTTAAPSASFATTGLSAPLRGQPLTPGRYRIAVRAVDKAGAMSPSGEATVELVIARLNNVKVYPNPWRSGRAMASKIVFENLTLDADVTVFTVAGHRVKRIRSSGGRAEWDLTNDSGDRVASGLYLYVATDPEGNKARGKLAILH